VAFATDSEADDDGAASEAGDGSEAEADAASRPALDADEFEVVAGGASGSKRKRGAGAAAVRGRKKRAATEENEQKEAKSASAFINELSSRYLQPSGSSSGSLLMSSVARREGATHLSYFEQIGAPARRSKSTLAGIPQLSEEECARIVAALPPRHEQPLARLHAHLESPRTMRHWFLCQSSGAFNLLCYGYGSKKKLLNHYARIWLTDAPVIVVHGYAPGTSAKSVLNTLTRDLMHLPLQTFRDLPAHVDFVRDWFRRDALTARGGGRRALKALQRVGRVRDIMEDGVGAGEAPVVYSEDEEQDADEASAAAGAKAGISSAAAPAPSSNGTSSAAMLPRVYIVIHNIDGASLRTDAQQAALAALASIPQVRLIASIDHIRANWLWPPSMLQQFNFVATDCTTFADYSAEPTANSASAGAGAVGGGVGELAGDAGSGGGLVSSQLRGRAAGIGNVLASLTPNHRMVLDKLAHIQLEPNNPDTKAMLLLSSVRASASGGGNVLVLLSAFEDACMDSMLVSSSENFSRLLGELRDHGLVTLRTVDRSKVLCIPYAAAVVRRHVLGDLSVSEEAVAAAHNAHQAQLESSGAEGTGAAAGKGGDRGGRGAFSRAAGADDEEDGDADERALLGEDAVLAAELDAAEGDESD
jgi:hypothetical protein